MPRAPAKPASGSQVSASTRILVLCGKERFLMDVHLKALRDALAKEHGAEIDTVRFDGTQGARILADVLDECRSFGLMHKHKIVMVDNADQLLKAGDDDESPAPAPRPGKRRAPAPRSARELLESYAESPSDNAALVLRAEVWRPGNLDKAILANGGLVIKCEPPTFDSALVWAQGRAKLRHNTSIDPATAELLITTVGLDLGRIDTELEKLALAAGGNGRPITAELVSAMVGATRQDEFWAIQSALLTRNPSAALGCLRDLVEVSRHDPVPITFAYVELARKVHVAARALADGIPENRFSWALKLWGPDAHTMKEAILAFARLAGPARAADLLDAAISTDAANKSGLGDPVRNLERLTLRFAAAAPSRVSGN